MMMMTTTTILLLLVMITIVMITTTVYPLLVGPHGCLQRGCLPETSRGISTRAPMKGTGEGGKVTMIYSLWVGHIWHPNFQWFIGSFSHDDG